jgi:gas vesicle protein
MNSNNSLYFLLGLGVGAAVALLYAPQSGSETRGYVRAKSESGKIYAKQIASDAADVAKKGTGKLKKTAVESVERGIKAVQTPLETLNAAIEVGKKAYQETVEGALGDSAAERVG